MELFIIYVPVGRHITRVLIIETPKFSTTLMTITTGLLALLETAWKGKEAMKIFVKTLNNRKRKVTKLSTTMEDISVMLPYSFVRSSCTKVAQFIISNLW